MGVVQNPAWTAVLHLVPAELDVRIVQTVPALMVVDNAPKELKTAFKILHSYVLERLLLSRKHNRLFPKFVLSIDINTSKLEDN